MNVFQTGLIITGLLAAHSVSGEGYFEVGLWHRGGMEIRVDGGSNAADTGARIARPGTRGDTASAVLPDDGDDGTVQILREFDDGFVGPSGMPLFSGMGQTQLFGYQNAAQHDAGGGTLTFTRTQSGSSQADRTLTTLNSSGGTWQDRGDLDGIGFQAKTGFIFMNKDNFDVSAQLQVGWLGGLDQSLGSQSAFEQELRQTTRQSTAERMETTRFVYDTFGNPFFPSAPYEMTDPSGTGPLISDTPIAILPGTASESSADQVVGRRSVVADSRVSLQTEADVFVLGLGPRFRLKINEDVSLLIQGGGTLNVLDARMRREERFVTEGGQIVGQWNQRADEQEWLWGASISAGAQWNLNDQLTLGASGGYDWVESVDLDIGPDQVRYALSGYQVELSLGWRFGGE